MAKAQTGLPAGFSLGVSAADLIGKGPVVLPGYLDEDEDTQSFEAARQRRQNAARTEHEQMAAPAVQVSVPQHVAVSTPSTVPVETTKIVTTSAQPPQQLYAVPEVKSAVVSAAPVATQLEAVPPVASTEVKPQRAKLRVRRHQMNLSVEVERKAFELLDIISEQSPERSVMISELIQALIINLYDARSDINVSRLPVRGQWGSPTAKSFPVALASLLKDAMLTHAQRQGVNSFKKVGGG